MVRLRPLLLASLAVVLVAVPASAATRLTTAVNGSVVEVEWADDAFPVRYKADQRLLATLPGGQAVLDRAFDAWSSLPKTRISFRADGVAAGLKAGRDGQNVITIADDLFANQRAIALTTNWDVDGKLVESDVQVDGSLIGSSYNIEQAIAHEIGHMLGLDHSAVLSAVMFPYVSRGTADVIVDSDDRVAIAAMYPEIDRTMAGGTLRGRVVGDGGGIFAAQVVAMNDRGEPVATGLTNESGEFTLAGVPDGKYRIYAEPLDGPVETRNLSSFWRQAKVTSFPTQFHSGEVTIESGQLYGNLIVSASGSVDLNPRWVGLAVAGSSGFTLTTTAVAARAGQTVALAIAGDGMISGMTTFDVLNPAVTRISDFRYAGNYVYADFQIAPNAPSGSAVILVRRGNETAALTGALRVHSASSTRGRIARR